jgi:hypothetical protein
MPTTPAMISKIPTPKRSRCQLFAMLTSRPGIAKGLDREGGPGHQDLMTVLTTAPTLGGPIYSPFVATATIRGRRSAVNSARTGDGLPTRTQFSLDKNGLPFL